VGSIRRGCPGVGKKRRTRGSGYFSGFRNGGPLSWRGALEKTGASGGNREGDAPWKKMEAWGKNWTIVDDQFPFNLGTGENS